MYKLSTQVDSTNRVTCSDGVRSHKVRSVRVRLNQTNKEIELEQEHFFLNYESSFQSLHHNIKEQEWEPRTRILYNV